MHQINNYMFLPSSVPIHKRAVHTTYWVKAHTHQFNPWLYIEMAYTERPCKTKNV